jgi:daunorubicin C-13 ketoreductase
VVRSNFGTGKLTRFFYRYAPFLVTPAKAGALLIWLATTPIGELTRGGYYVGHKLTEPEKVAADPVLAAKLWDSSTKAVGL